MAEIKSLFSNESIQEYARENNLDVLNSQQIAAKFMELEQELSNIDDRITRLEKDKHAIKL